MNECPVHEPLPIVQRDGGKADRASSKPEDLPEVKPALAGSLRRRMGRNFQRAAVRDGFAGLAKPSWDG